MLVNRMGKFWSLRRKKEPLSSDPPHSSDQNFDFFHLSAYEQIGVDLGTGAPITDPIFIITDNSELVDFTKSGLKNFLLHILNVKEYASQISEQDLSQTNVESLRAGLIEFRQRYAPDTSLNSTNVEDNGAEYVQNVVKYLDELQERAVAVGNYLTEMLREILLQEDYETLRQFYNGIDA
ncbi:hypothetical protein ACTXT7_011491 [Hymenolepis weldensis]